LANTAIIGAGVNIRISDKDPLAYSAKYGIGPDKRSQQFIQGAVEAMSRDKYAKWLNARTQSLATAANAYLLDPRGIKETPAVA
jgi:hypothetical protein